MVEVAKLGNKDSAKHAFYLVSNDEATGLATYKIHNPKQQDLHLLVDTWNERFYPKKATKNGKKVTCIDGIFLQWFSTVLTRDSDNKVLID